MQDLILDNEIKEEIIQPRQLLVDICSLLKLDVQAINESIAQNNGRLIIKRVKMQAADIKNQNGRVYPGKTIRDKVKEFQKFIDENRAFGELDHPDSEIVEVKNACITVERLWWEGDTLYGDIEVLIGTPSGDIVAAILRLGKTLGISSRALGSVKEIAEGTVQVQGDLSFVAWDVVSNPSTFQSFIKLHENIISESIEINNKYDNVNNIIRNIICSDGNCELRLTHKNN